MADSSAEAGLAAEAADSTAFSILEGAVSELGAEPVPLDSDAAGEDSEDAQEPRETRETLNMQNGQEADAQDAEDDEEDEGGEEDDEEEDDEEDEGGEEDEDEENEEEDEEDEEEEEEEKDAQEPQDLQDPQGPQELQNARESEGPQSPEERDTQLPLGLQAQQDALDSTSQTAAAPTEEATPASAAKIESMTPTEAAERRLAIAYLFVDDVLSPRQIDTMRRAAAPRLDCARSWLGQTSERSHPSSLAHLRDMVRAPDSKALAARGTKGDRRLRKHRPKVRRATRSVLYNSAVLEGLMRLSVCGFDASDAEISLRAHAEGAVRRCTACGRLGHSKRSCLLLADEEKVGSESLARARQQYRQPPAAIAPAVGIDHVLLDGVSAVPSRIAAPPRRSRPPRKRPQRPQRPQRPPRQPRPGAFASSEWHTGRKMDTAIDHGLLYHSDEEAPHIAAAPSARNEKVGVDGAAARDIEVSVSVVNGVMIEEAEESLRGTPSLHALAGGYDTEAEDDAAGAAAGAADGPAPSRFYHVVETRPGAGGGGDGAGDAEAAEELPEGICEVFAVPSRASARVPRALKYDADALSWLPDFSGNEEDTYCYCGKGASERRPMLRCGMCAVLFHGDCVAERRRDFRLLWGEDANVEFYCSVCVYRSHTVAASDCGEYLCRKPMPWLDIVRVALANLSVDAQRCGERAEFPRARICAFVDDRWATFGVGKEKASNWEATVLHVLRTNEGGAFARRTEPGTRRHVWRLNPAGVPLCSTGLPRDLYAAIGVQLLSETGEKGLVSLSDAVALLAAQSIHAPPPIAAAAAATVGAVGAAATAATTAAAAPRRRSGKASPGKARKRRAGGAPRATPAKKARYTDAYDYAVMAAVSAAEEEERQAAMGGAGAPEGGLEALEGGAAVNLGAPEALRRGDIVWAKREGAAAKGGRRLSRVEAGEDWWPAQVISEPDGASVHVKFLGERVSSRTRTRHILAYRRNYEAFAFGRAYCKLPDFQIALQRADDIADDIDARRDRKRGQAATPVRRRRRQSPSQSEKPPPQQPEQQRGTPEKRVRLKPGPKKGWKIARAAEAARRAAELAAAAAAPAVAAGEGTKEAEEGAPAAAAGETTPAQRAAPRTREVRRRSPRGGGSMAVFKGDGKEHEVECLVKHRGEGTSGRWWREYLVRWRDPAMEDSWELEENIKCRRLIDALGAELGKAL